MTSHSPLESTRLRQPRLRSASRQATSPSRHSATRTSTATYDPRTGALATTVVEPDDPDLELTTSTTYNGFGNVVRVERKSPDGGSRSTELLFDDTEPQFAFEVTNALGQATRSRYNRDLGLVVETADANELVSSWTFDAMGSVRSPIPPRAGFVRYRGPLSWASTPTT